MNKEIFIDTINFMKKLSVESEGFNDILKSIDNEFGGCYIHNKTISYLENMLAKLVNDKYEYISYYLWELDFGTKYYDGCITEEDGTIIKLSTPEDLYNLIIKED